MPTPETTTAPPRLPPDPTPALRPPVVVRPAVGPADAPALEATLHGLYRRQLETHPGDPYLTAHGSARFVADQVRTFLTYAPFLPPAGAVLDWGCNHAPDSCLLRAAFGDRFDLHGCDFAARAGYAAFHRSAGLAFRELDDVLKLPFPDAKFDAVVASGTLEHVAMDGESLKELYRVMRPGSVLIISYLPNWLSVAECRDRLLGRDHHRRRYGLAEARRLLLSHGFEPLAAGRQTFLWERAFAGFPALATLARAVCPVHLFASTLYLIAHKRESM